MEINSIKQNKENPLVKVDKIFYLTCFAFAAGVLWRSFVHIDLKDVIFTGTAYLLLVLISFILKKDWSVYASIMAIALLVGIARFDMADVQPPAFFENQTNKTISLQAMIVDEPARNASQTKLIVETKSSSAANVGIVVFSKIEQKSGDGKEFHYGDEIEMTGKLQKPANFMTDQDMEFDYVNYLRKDGIFYTMKDPQIEILSSDHGNPIKRALFSWRERFDEAIDRAIPAPESIVEGGIIIGERYAFSEQLRQIFMDTGTIHIVTIGGYHVTLVAQWMMKIFSFLPKFAGTGMGIVSIFLYVIATGGAQTSIRAGIMATLALFASATGRMYASGRALILAAVVMILMNPFVLVYDVSFELSFMATIAIIFLSPQIERYFNWIRWKWLREIVAITSSMYMFALPFVLYRIGNLSLVSLPANLAVVPLMPITMIAGFVTGFAGIVSPILAVIPGQIATSFLYLQIAAVAFLAHIPFAAVAIQNFSLPIVIVIYGIFLSIFFKGNAGEKEWIKNENRKGSTKNKDEAPYASFVEQIDDPSGREFGFRNRVMARRENVSGAEPISASETRRERESACSKIESFEPERLKISRFRLFMLLSPLIVTFCAAGFLYFNHYESNRASLDEIQRLLSDNGQKTNSNCNYNCNPQFSTSSQTSDIQHQTSSSASTAMQQTYPAISGSSSTDHLNVFVPDKRTRSDGCKVNGVYPDHSCTPGAIFADATEKDICVKGYTATVRNVSEKTKEQVFEEYSMTYSHVPGAFEVDHFIPLALGGANDIANLFPEAAAPTPGFHEKDVVEVFLQEQVCSGHANLSAAQRQISTDWLAVYNNIPFEDKQRIIKKYGGSAVQ